MKLRDGEKWHGWREAKKTLQESKQYDPELNQIYGKLLHEVFFRRVKAGETPGFPRVRKRHNFFTLCYPAMYVTIEGKNLILPTGGYGKNKQYPNIVTRLREEPPNDFKEVAISKRTYRCMVCGLVMDRDENSAVNILTRYLARLGPHMERISMRCADVFTAI